MTLTIVAVVFGIFAIGQIVLLIYKRLLTMHRDDQLFLDDTSSHLHAEQTSELAGCLSESDHKTKLQALAEEATEKAARLRLQIRLMRDHQAIA